MLNLVGQFLEALFLPAVAGAVIGGVLLLATPRRRVVVPRQRAAAPSMGAAKKRPSTCMATGRHSAMRGARGLSSLEAGRRTSAGTPQRQR